MKLRNFPLSPAHFARIDKTADSLFYAVPRIVTHIDDNGIRAIQTFLNRCLPKHTIILDLMSSAFSHLPDGFPCQRVVGLGLNEIELRSNQVLDEYVIHDLNAEPNLPFTDAEFGGVILTASVQYLTQPVTIFREVRRILRPNGPFIVIFSNRMFITKAVAIWRMTSDEGHIDLVKQYFCQAGGFYNIAFTDETPSAEGYTDPVYIVMARKQS
ncbi:MAG: methyltransferase domain-containing protein [Candidatus Poribacteria bacterium]|nr:methyltransferase domain-containing protein [Candidatus Poribacteria bacterium]